ncbi:MAG: hypothetical protein GY941_22300 [Planctomycetes bacterium]|nr:hypothetical protein [Planctomycetota bacterium]
MSNCLNEWSQTGSSTENIGLSIIILVWLVVLVGVIGWCMNIVKLTQCDFKPSYKTEIVRGIGIPVPIVGAVYGFFPNNEVVEGE